MRLLRRGGLEKMNVYHIRSRLRNRATINIKQWPIELHIVICIVGNRLNSLS